MTAPPLKPGSLLQGYKILDLVGQGAFGRVYKAQTGTGGANAWTVAIKELYVTNPDAITRFEAEANMMRNLMHPNIPLVDNYFVDGGRFFLVIRWVEGKPWHKCDPARANQRDLTNVAIDVLKALEYLHSKGIIHRDVKPANILPEWNPYHTYLVDLGVARNQKTARQALTQVGTPSFMSPQQALGANPVPADDVLSVGASLFYMMAPAGTAHADRVIPAYTAGSTPPELARMLLGYSDRFSYRFRQVVATSLEFDTLKRYETAEQMRVALEESLNDLGADAGGGTPPGDLPPVNPGGADQDFPPMATTSTTRVGKVNVRQGWNPRREEE